MVVLQPNRPSVAMSVTRAQRRLLNKSRYGAPPNRRVDAHVTLFKDSMTTSPCVVSSCHRVCEPVVPSSKMFKAGTLNDRRLGASDSSVAKAREAFFRILRYVGVTRLMRRLVVLYFSRNN